MGRVGAGLGVSAGNSNAAGNDADKEKWPKTSRQCPGGNTIIQPPVLEAVA